MTPKELTLWLDELILLNPDTKHLDELITHFQTLLTNPNPKTLLPNIINCLVKMVELDSNESFNRINYPSNKTAGMLVEHFRKPSQIKIFQNSNYFSNITIEDVIRSIPDSLDKTNTDSLLLFFNTLFYWNLQLPRENNQIIPFSKENKEKYRQLFDKKIKNNDVIFMLSQTHFTLSQISMLLAEEKSISATASNLNISLKTLFDSCLEENERLDAKAPEVREINNLSSALHQACFCFIANKIETTDPKNEQILVMRQKILLFKESAHLFSDDQELKNFHRLIISAPPKGLALIKQLLRLKEKINDFNKRGETLASTTAMTLFSGLVNQSIDHFSSTGYGKHNIDEFNKQCLLLLEKAKPVLEKHRGCKEILGNIALAIVGFGVFYLSAGLINWATTGKFSFFSTKTEKIMDDIKKNINTPDP